VTEIAAELRVSAPVVSRTLQLAEVADAINSAHAIAREDAARVLSASALAAVRVLVALAGGCPDEKGRLTVADAVRLRAATEVLDRCGLHRAERREVSGPDAGPVQTETRIELAGMSLEQIDALLARL